MGPEVRGGRLGAGWAGLGGGVPAQVTGEFGAGMALWWGQSGQKWQRAPCPGLFGLGVLRSRANIPCADRSV